MMLRSFTLFLSFVLIAGAARAETLSKNHLVESLRNGGYTLYFRHAATDWSQSDHVVKTGDWKTCDPGKMRQLSDEGRVAAKRIGKSIRDLGIPIGAILSSEYCRAVETVKLMDLGRNEATTDVMNLRAARFVGGNDAAVARLQAILKKPPASGKNRVISGHGNLARAATGAYPKEGGAIVILATDETPLGFRVIGQIGPAEWSK